MANELQPDDSVIKRIQALLNLGNRGGTEAEASLAMDKAQELMAKYNLDMARIESTYVEGGTVAKPKEKREQTKIDRSAMYRWQQNLCRVIAESNFCWHWVQEALEDKPRVSAGRSYCHLVKRHMILGKESNVVAVRLMYEWLAETIEDILPFEKTYRNSKSAVSWREGCADRLAERIALKAYRMHNPITGDKKATETGLVLRSIAQKEHEGNYDAAYGEGSYSKAMMRMEKAKAEPIPEKTPEELEKEKKASEKFWKRYHKRQERIEGNRDHDAYCLGREAGEAISLMDRIN